MMALDLRLSPRINVSAPFYGWHEEAWWREEKPQLWRLLEAQLPTTPIHPDNATAHTAYTLHIGGATTVGFDRLAVTTDVHIRGARWRSYDHGTLCTSMADPIEDEVAHTCNVKGPGTFQAAVWLFVPGTRPAAQLDDVLEKRFPLASVSSLRPPPAASWQDMRVLAKYVDSRVCEWSVPLLTERTLFAHGGLASVLRAKCTEPASSAVRLTDVLNARAWRTHGRRTIMQVGGDDLVAVGAAFMLAARTLPHPFAIVESGNLCGGSTVLLALLRRRFCPSCPFTSADPGWFRPIMKQDYTCARDTIAWAGLTEDVTIYDGPGAALSGLEQPVGFVYLDDGKARFFNEPLMMYLRPRLMRGAVVAMDDAWHEEILPHSTRYYGQVQYAAELVDAGDCIPLVVAPPPEMYVNGSYARRGGLGYSQQASKSMHEIKREIARFKQFVGQARFHHLRERWAHPGMTVVLSCDQAGRAGPPGDQLRVSLVDKATGAEQARGWIALPA
jgi:predicted O-methyltransferase YrrM